MSQFDHVVRPIQAAAQFTPAAVSTPTAVVAVTPFLWAEQAMRVAVNLPTQPVAYTTVRGEDLLGRTPAELARDYADLEDLFAGR